MVNSRLMGTAYAFEAGLKPMQVMQVAPTNPMAPIGREPGVRAQKAGCLQIVVATATLQPYSIDRPAKLTKIHLWYSTKQPALESSQSCRWVKGELHALPSRALSVK